MNLCPACREVRPHTKREWITYHPNLVAPESDRDPDAERHAAWKQGLHASREAAKILRDTNGHEAYLPGLRRPAQTQH